MLIAAVISCDLTKNYNQCDYIISTGTNHHDSQITDVLAGMRHHTLDYDVNMVKLIPAEHQHVSHSVRAAKVTVDC